MQQAGDRRDQRPGGRRRRHDDAADGHPPRQHDGQDSGSSSPGAASCPRRARRGSCRGWSASARRRSGATPVGCSAPTRRWPVAWCAASTSRDELLPAARAIAAEIAENTSPGQRRPDSSDAVAMLAPIIRWRRIASTRVESIERGRSADVARGRRELPGEAPGGVPRSGQRRAARRLPGAADSKVLVKPTAFRADVTYATVRSRNTTDSYML